MGVNERATPAGMKETTTLAADLLAAAASADLSAMAAAPTGAGVAVDLPAATMMTALPWSSWERDRGS
jgi:thiamine monophosphate kinase